MALPGSRPLAAVQQQLSLCRRAYAAANGSGGGGGVGSLFKSFWQRPRRNPRIIPHAKVKAFRVREWHNRDPEATAVFQEHLQRYEMQLSALQQTFYYELHGRLLLPGEYAEAGLHRLGSREDRLADTAEARRHADEAEKLNADWNAASAEQHVADMRQRLVEMRDRRDRLQLDKELAEKAAVLSFQARVKRDSAQAANFIVDEASLEARIDAIIDSPVVDFNFAIDPAGNVIGGSGSGSGGPPSTTEPPEPPSLEELSVQV